MSSARKGSGWGSQYVSAILKFCFYFLLLKSFHKLRPRRGSSKKRPVPWHQCIYLYWGTVLPGIISLLLKFTQGVPIEVVPFAYFKVLQNLKNILGSPKATLRMAVKKGKCRVDTPCFYYTWHSSFPSWTSCYRQWKLYYRCSLRSRENDWSIYCKLFFFVLSQSHSKTLNGYVDNVADENVKWSGWGGSLLPYGEGGIFRKRGEMTTWVTLLKPRSKLIITIGWFGDHQMERWSSAADICRKCELDFID